MVTLPASAELPAQSFPGPKHGPVLYTGDGYRFAVEKPRRVAKPIDRRECGLLEIASARFPLPSSASTTAVIGSTTSP